MTGWGIELRFDLASTLASWYVEVMFGALESQRRRTAKELQNLVLSPDRQWPKITWETLGAPLGDIVGIVACCFELLGFAGT